MEANLVNLSSFKSITLAAALLLGANTARAELMLEPYAGYESATSSLGVSTNPVTAPSGGSIQSNLSGVDAGVKLGVRSGNFFIAADYSYGWLNSSVTSQPTGFTQSGGQVTRSTLGAIIGGHLGFLKLFAGYDFLNDWDYKASGSQTNDLTLHGSGLHAGLGIRLVSRVHLNAEYRLSTFTKYSQGGDFDLSDANTYNSAKASSIMVTLSFPLRL